MECGEKWLKIINATSPVYELVKGKEMSEMVNVTTFRAYGRMQCTGDSSGKYIETSTYKVVTGRLREHITELEKERDELKSRNEQLVLDWQEMFDEGEHFLEEVCLLFNEWDGDLTFESVKYKVSRLHGDLLYWTEFILRMLTMQGKQNTNTFKRVTKCRKHWEAVKK